MPTLNANNAYLEIGGTNVSAYWTDEIDFSSSNSTVEVTAGAGATHVERAGGLSDTSLSFSVVYDTADIALYRAKLIEGTEYAVIYGPEGNTSGKPKFQCQMILEEVSGPNVTIAKDKVMFELSFVGAAAPTATISGGSTF
jgi:hypothetical protein